jgi:hypothetical protein
MFFSQHKNQVFGSPYSLPLAIENRGTTAVDMLDGCEYGTNVCMHKNNEH